jgi:hypothetical protein
MLLHRNFGMFWTSIDMINYLEQSKKEKKIDLWFYETI